MEMNRNKYVILMNCEYREGKRNKLERTETEQIPIPFDYKHNKMKLLFIFRFNPHRN